MDNEKFPHVDVEQELFFRDIFFLNYHINHDKWDWWKFQDIIDAHRLEEDWNWWDDYEWTQTEVGAAGTIAIGDIPNGVLVVTTDAADNDYEDIATQGEIFKIVDNYPLYFEIRAKVDDAEQSDLWAGLLNSNSYFAGFGTDGIYFLKPDGAKSLYFVVQALNVENSVDTGIDSEDLTWVRLGFHWDGEGNIRWFVIDDTNPPQKILASGIVTTLPTQTEELYLGFGIRNGEAASKVLYVDYVKCVQKRLVGDDSDEEGGLESGA